MICSDGGRLGRVVSTSNSNEVIKNRDDVIQKPMHVLCEHAHADFMCGLNQCRNPTYGNASSLKLEVGVQIWNRASVPCKAAAVTV
jgi:hypothetical protein